MLDPKITTLLIVSQCGSFTRAAENAVKTGA